MPMGSGRKKGFEWLQVSEIEGCTSKVICDHCNDQISAKIERVRNHLKNCPSKIESSSKVEIELFLPSQSSSPSTTRPTAPLSLHSKPGSSMEVITSDESFTEATGSTSDLHPLL